MATERRRGAPWLGVAVAASTLGVLAVGYVASGEGDDSAPPSSTPLEGSLLLDAQFDEGIDVTGEIIDALAAAGDVPDKISADYGGCDTSDPEEAVADVQGWVDHPDGRPSTEADVQAGLDLLIDMGWTPRDDGRWIEGVWERGTGWSVSAERDDLTAFIYYARTGPYDAAVRVRVLGPCVPILDDQDERFDVFEPLEIEIGPASSTPPASTPSSSSP
jgi:hypothetical protein